MNEEGENGFERWRAELDTRTHDLDHARTIHRNQSSVIIIRTEVFDKDARFK